MPAKSIHVLEELHLPRGFQASGVAAGLKRSGGRDVALLVSDVPAVVAGTFTTNQVKAASVQLCLERIKKRKGRAVVVNSGNANACTGAQGRKDSAAMTERVAQRLGIKTEEVFVCSTGTIGVPLPMEKVLAGIDHAARVLSPGGASDASEAICTTDRWPKYCTVKLRIDGQPVTVMAMAKGAGMIEPNMATMLAFVLTDAAAAGPALQAGLKEAVDASFNRISVDGDMSTNDTVLCFANGQAGNAPLDEKHKDWKRFMEALRAVCHSLALKMVRDGEGASKVITVKVAGARNQADAEAAARAVANSMLVKTSWNGKRCNWGRVMDALGYSAAKVQEDLVRIAYDGVPAVEKGVAAATPYSKLEKIVQKEYFTLDIHLGLGKGVAHVFACDTGHEYIDINV